MLVLVISGLQSASVPAMRNQRQPTRTGIQLSPINHTKVEMAQAIGYSLQALGSYSQENPQHRQFK